MSHQDRPLPESSRSLPLTERRYAIRYGLWLLAGLWLAKSLQGIPILGVLLASCVVASQLLLPLHRIDHYRIQEDSIGWTWQGWPQGLLLWLGYSAFWLGSLEFLLFILGQRWPALQLQPLTWPSYAYPQLLAAGQVLLHQLLAVALPEETFFRGYLRTLWPGPNGAHASLARAASRWLPVALDSHALAIAGVFALTHLVGEWQVGRLLTVLPALVFVRLFDHQRRLLAPVLFHATCNIWSMLRLAPLLA